MGDPGSWPIPGCCECVPFPHHHTARMPLYMIEKYNSPPLSQDLVLFPMHSLQVRWLWPLPGSGVVHNASMFSSVLLHLLEAQLQWHAPPDPGSTCKGQPEVPTGSQSSACKKVARGPPARKAPTSMRSSRTLTSSGTNRDKEPREFCATHQRTGRSESLLVGVI